MRLADAFHGSNVRASYIRCLLEDRRGWRLHRECDGLRITRPDCRIV